MIGKAQIKTDGVYSWVITLQIKQTDITDLKIISRVWFCRFEIEISQKLSDQHAKEREEKEQENSFSFFLDEK